MNAAKTILVSLMVALSAISSALPADQRARTTDGREVILHDDGTWTYAPKSANPGSLSFDKPKGSVLQYTGKRQNFALYLLPNAWKKGAPKNDDAEVGFTHMDGDAYAIVITERISIPLDTLKNAALDNILAVDKNAKLVAEEKRMVNGSEVLCLTFNAAPSGIQVTLYGYYYTDDSGSIQIITYTGQNLFEEFKPELDKFLNGFVVLKKPTK